VLGLPKEAALFQWKSLILIVVLFAISLVSGCSLINSVKVSSSQPDSLPVLLGTHWNLYGWGTVSDPQGLLDGTQITLDFTGDGDGLKGRISGGSGCNSYFGSYEISGDSIKITGIGSTKKYCSTPDGLMTQEDHFFGILKSASGYHLYGGQLDINVGGGEILFFVVLHS
jgi:heat shock protein HslJ